MANELLGKTPADTYKDILHLGTATGSTPGTGLPATTGQIVYDGAGVASKLKLSQSKIEADNIFITNGTISSLSAPITVAQGGTGGTSTTVVKALWGIDNVENTALSTWAGTSSLTTLGIISSGTWNGSTIAVANGGTGTTSLASLKSALSLNLVENTAISTWAGSSNLTTLGTIALGTWNGTAISIAYGGTGATSASGARTALGIGTIGTQAANSVAITGGTLAGVSLTTPTITNPTITSLTSLDVGNISLSGATIQHTTAGTTISIPLLESDSVLGDIISVQRDPSTTAGLATVQISQQGTDTEDLLNIADENAVTKTKFSSTGTQLSNQLSGSDFLVCRKGETTSLSGTFSVYASDKDIIESHSSSFTSTNIAAGDIVRIRATGVGSWETREVSVRTDDGHITLNQPLTNTYSSTAHFERRASDASTSFKVTNGGTTEISGGGWNSGHLVLGSYHIWVDSTGSLRMKNSAPSSDTDGTVVGTQT